LTALSPTRNVCAPQWRNISCSRGASAVFPPGRDGFPSGGVSSHKVRVICTDHSLLIVLLSRSCRLNIHGASAALRPYGDDDFPSNAAPCRRLRGATRVVTHLFRELSISHRCHNFIKYRFRSSKLFAYVYVCVIGSNRRFTM
jgi:hypothetical protein